MEVNKNKELVGNVDGPQGQERKIIKQRGFWLSAFLVLMMLVNPLTALSYFFVPEMMTLMYPQMVIGLAYFMGFLAVVNTVLAIAMWNWKKLGVYGFYLVSAIAFGINIYVGLGIFGAVLGLIGPAIIWATTTSRWQQFS